jgi:ParE toxin of type II toxin-antitoxin system, parDE
MKLILLHEAEIEFWKSVDYYERRHPGLGVRFKEEVDRYLERIRTGPLLPTVRKSGYRRVNLSVFRHYIAYVIRDDVLWVVAICHSHRAPEFWLSRVPP